MFSSSPTTRRCLDARFGYVDEPGKFNHPRGVAVHKALRLVVVSDENDHLQVLRFSVDNKGPRLTHVSSFGRGSATAVAPPTTTFARACTTSCAHNRLPFRLPYRRQSVCSEGIALVLVSTVLNNIVACCDRAR